jgi:undecaprenyl-diphosphatase
VPALPDVTPGAAAVAAVVDAASEVVGRRRWLRTPAAVARRVTAFDQAADIALGRLRGREVADRAFYAASELGDYSLLWHIVGTARGLRSDRDTAEAVRLSGILIVESVLVNGVIKQAFRRTRPVWEQPRAYTIRRPRSSSFPSGHASAAFTAATILGERSRVWPLWYAGAALVASSRAYVRIHHASDVVAGVATGLVLGRAARRAWPAPIDASPFSGFRARRSAEHLVDPDPLAPV